MGQSQSSHKSPLKSAAMPPAPQQMELKRTTAGCTGEESPLVVETDKQVQHHLDNCEKQGAPCGKALVQKGKLDMRLVTMELWKNRSNVNFIGVVCEELSKIIDEKPVLDQVEFYLPQLAHMVLHLEGELTMTAMEQFVMLVSQSSVHFALQFFWNVYATLDENRPKRNGNAKLFIRCSQLLLTLEQCLVYGSPNARQAHQLYESNSISRLEMDKILMADRRFFAAQHASTPIDGHKSSTCSIEGWLFKKGGGTSRMGRRNWSSRWCRIERRVLFVYTRESDIVARSAIPLDRADVHVIQNPKHDFYFEIHSQYSDKKFKVSF